MGSVLVNGSPTTEFKFFKGLKQGDPLSPFLFIIVMESLHIAFTKVLNARIFKGIPINESLSLSHFFYADDAIFVDKWEVTNISAIVNILNVFHMASSLKINIHKSKLMGVGVCREGVESAAGFKSNGSSSWARVIKAINGKNGSINGTIKSSYKSPWTDIIREINSLAKNGISLFSFVKKKIGNGEDTLFWKDSWHADDPLKNLYPRIFALESAKDITVAEKFLDSSFSSTLRRNPRGGLKESEFDLLCSNLANAILPYSCDRWVWNIDAN
ncbi:RNA-directed DNA polymerase, eukaryota, reverse transcriptase zinc-binding domain protein [Tanacetum coccineum]